MSAFEDAVIQRIKQLEREVERLKRWERPIVITDHGALAGLGDNDHPQYLLTTAKAADSDKLDGNDSSYFAAAAHTHLINLPLGGFTLLNGAQHVAYGNGASISLPDTSTPICDITVPIIYSGKSLRMNLLLTSTLTGSVTISFEIRRLLTGAGYPGNPTLYNSKSITVSTAYDLVKLISDNLNVSGYSAGEFLAVRIYRLTNDANTGVVHIVGVYLEAV